LKDYCNFGPGLSTTAAWKSMKECCAEKDKYKMLGIVTI